MTSQDQSNISDLTALLAPTCAEHFFREHWERKPLHLSRGDAHYFDSILTNGDLENIISSADMCLSGNPARQERLIPCCGQGWHRARESGGPLFNYVIKLPCVLKNNKECMTTTQTATTQHT